jgi:hypothetical protein
MSIDFPMEFLMKIMNGSFSLAEHIAVFAHFYNGANDSDEHIASIFRASSQAGDT